MKKGLSVLLIAAALFGFYGGATSLNDVLAAKDYWEEEGEKSTADMNKLEDGLNQLADNKEAYLDGLKQVEEGEKALEEGKATLAEGEADYAAAPGLLADARVQIAQGEADLAEGKEALDGLTQLINGIKQVRSGYNSSWRPNYELLKDGRKQLYDGTKGLKSEMVQLAAFLDDTSMRPAYVAAVNDVAGDDEKQTANDYKKFADSTSTLSEDIPVIQTSVSEKLAGAKQIKTALTAASSNLEFAGTVANENVYPNLLAFAALITEESSQKTYTETVKQVKEAFDTYSGYISKDVTEAVTAYMAPLMQDPPDTSSKAYQAMVAKMGAGMTQAEAVEAIKADKIKSETADATQKYAAVAETNANLTAAKTGINSAVATIVATLTQVDAIVNGDKINKVLLPGLAKFTAGATDENIDALADGQDTVAGGIATIASAVLGNSTLKAGVKDNFGNKAIALLKTYKSSTGPLSTSRSDFAAFETQMDKNPGVKGFLLKAQKLLAQTRADGLKTYNAGLKKLAAGKAEYAQGLADYAAAPGKLEEGRKALADGLKELMEGKEKLAEYEDGEQQVREGLATLMSTEPDPGLESILERNNGDDDFEEANGTLDTEEGLDAVDVGRGYQSDSGELITEEVMARAVATGVGAIGAGVLALLAALLGLFKKNKAAAVTAILAAIAGAVGAFMGSGAGYFYTEQSGATSGSTPWVAAGVLAAVALVFAVVHFNVKKEEA